MKYKLKPLLSSELEKYRDRIEATIKPYIEITIENNDRVNWWQSKFGGLPYLPKGFEYPRTSGNKYLYLLAQINWEEVPLLEGFPERGILQFYIADDDLYGLDFCDRTEPSNSVAEPKFRILYFPQPDLNVENIITNYDFLPKPEYFPVTGCANLLFTKKFAPISYNDYLFTKVLGEDFFNLLKTNKIIENEYIEMSSPGGHKIGGYPDFVQGDVRVFDRSDEPDPDLLLFQMDSDENDVVHIMWGDSGIANFFIYKTALKTLDFSNVLYNWDCS